MIKSKEISSNRLATLCSNIDEQAIVDACLYIKQNGVPSNRIPNTVSYVLINKKQYPLKYVFEIANNEIVKNKIKIGPQYEYTPKNSGVVESAMKLLFPKPKKFSIATDSNEEGRKILNEYRTNLLNYAKSAGLVVKNKSKKHSNTWKDANNFTHIEKYVEKYVEICLENEGIVAQIFSVAEFGLGFPINFNYDILDEKGKRLFCDGCLYGDIICSEKDLNWACKIIDYIARNTK